MTSSEQMRVEFDAYESELAKLSADIGSEDGDPVVADLLDKISRNLVRIRDSEMPWWKQRAWIVATRFAVYTTISTQSIRELIEMGCEI